MRKKQICVVLIVFAFINVASISMALFVAGETKSDDSLDGGLLDSLKVRDYKGIDGTQRFEGRTLSDEQSIQGITLANIQPDIEAGWTVQIIDDYKMTNYDQSFDLVLEGEHCNIWIGLNPEVFDGGFQDKYESNDEGFEDDVWYFAYPWSSIGIDAKEAAAPDPDNDGYYLPEGYMDWITGEDLLYIQEEFDNNIHENVVEHFGDYNYRPGPEDDGKIQVLIFNIRDGLFYDPINAPWFIMGYYWSVVSEANDANIFHMDTYQWWRRCGVNPTSDFGLGPLPLQYEGTFAHEFQHLIHHDVDENELSWVNEGCSVLAEWICGYGFPSGHISEYIINWWSTSLVFWQGTLADYGVVFLWTFYLWEHYGGDDLIYDLVQEQANGIEGWSKVLELHDSEKTFDEIFQDWAIANYLDGDGLYGYDHGLDLPSDDTEGWSIPFTLYNWEHLNPTFFDTQVQHYPNVGFNYPYGSSIPYVANYVEFYKVGEPHELTIDFDGDDFCGVMAHEGEYKWHSGGDAWAWYRLGRTFNIPTTGTTTLNFWSLFEIELDWDYGYVEVHDIDTDQWYTLQGIKSVEDVGANYGTDNENCPDEVEPTTYYDAGRWYGFTGSSNGWYEESMDLSMFAGHEIELFFTYWTDPFTLEAGWYIDEISITGDGFSFTDNVEDGDDGWIYNGWERNNALYDNDFKVNFIGLTNTYTPSGKWVGSEYDLFSMTLDPETEAGQAKMVLYDLGGQQRYVVMVVANQPGFEHTFGTTYSFIADVVKLDDYPWNWNWRF